MVDVIFEYGLEIPKSIDNYFDILDEHRIKDCELNIDISNKEKAGTYSGVLKWHDEIHFFDIVIKDTKAPGITLKEEKIIITEGQTFKPESNVKKVEDPVDGKIEPEFIGKVDTNKAGKYEIEVKATDINNNVTSKKFTVTVKSKQGVPQHIVENNSFKTKQYYISTSKIGKTFQYKYTAQIYNAIYNGQYDTKFFYDTHDSQFQDSLWEFERLFFGEIYPHLYYSKNAEEKYYYLNINDKEGLDALVQKTKTKVNSYNNFIVNSLKGMDLNCTDVEMVQQINNFIVKRFSYKVTDIHNVRSFVELGHGQCWHYAMFFIDMCKAVGINVQYIQGTAYGDSHALNSVIIDGTKYYFDVTLNDSMKTNKWSFMSKSEIRKTHTW